MFFANQHPELHEPTSLCAAHRSSENEEGPRWGERGPSKPTWGDVGCGRYVTERCQYVPIPSRCAT